ncbi:MAG: UDPglucose--hexose-phosphate uridylyltransferase [Candidatus Sumerlaeota bacterium]|nr:UDPglucose--hexose-phosphate uridylyltransferase [Candidatus Sumerlaeota bacterium]
MKSGTEVLPVQASLAQEDVQTALQRARDAGASLAECLGILQRWSEAVGYFAHLGEPNEFLVFPDASLGLDLRLQINYSRLAYKAPEGRRIGCPLCFENIGTPGKELLRVFEFNLAGVPYFSHLTPFPLHSGHFVLNARTHEPMRIGEPALREAAAFLAEAPGWLLASNSDVEWAGASVLSHHHCQLFRELRLPIEDAAVRSPGQVGDVACDLLCWPGPVYRLSGPEEATLDAAARLIALWKARDPGRCTCNYLMRRTDSSGLVLHLFMRHPDWRTPEHLRSIKSEGVGIIEVAGEVIVPPLAGKTRAENREFFEAEGLRVIHGIIGGNAPLDERLDWDFYAAFPSLL